MKLITKIGIGMCLLLGLWSCGDDDQFDPVPELFYRDFQIVGDSLFIWSLGFTDGDGDIGVRNDNDPNNFFPQGFMIVDGVEMPFPAPDTLEQFRIPVVRNVITRNGIEGEFKFTQEMAFYRLLSIDSMYIEAYVEDRSLNRSNTVRTPVFVVN